IGGATGAIGDPSGRSTERTALDKEVLDRNVEAIETQIKQIFANGQQYAAKKRLIHASSSSDLPPIKFVNNHDWLKNMSFLDFMGDVGRLARVPTMLARDSVKNRLETDEGLSFTEFTYQLLQAYDFWHLYTNHRCTIQLGGSDQWGNMMAGTDLIRRKLHLERVEGSGKSGESKSGENDPAIALTLPLVTTATGEKFGKSAGNAVWLDEGLCSAFDFYQFFRRAPDSEVGRYLQYFTFLGLDEIKVLLAQHQVEPQKHLPQRTLAREVTELVHGEAAALKAQVMSQVLYDDSFHSVTAPELLYAFSGNDRLMRMERGQVVGREVWEVVLSTGAVRSERQAKSLQKLGGLYLNKVRVPPEGRVITTEDLLGGRVCLIRTGKENYKVLDVQ
ncbi:tyrosyl-tRNA synthetase, partial [Rhizophlyctis rosea]